MNKSLFLFYFLFWAAGRIYLFGNDYLSALSLHSAGLHFDIICLLSYIIHITPYNEIKKKIFWGYFLIYELISFSFYIFINIDKDHFERMVSFSFMKSQAWHNGFLLGLLQESFIPIAVVYVGYQIYIKLERFDSSKNHDLNDENVFLVFTYPKNLIGLFMCIFTPVKANSVALYSKGFLYRFRKEYGSLEATKTDLPKSKYLCINTNILSDDVSEKIRNLINYNWSLKDNCLTVFQTVTGPLRQYI